MSEVVFSKSKMEHILRMSPENMRKIIKTDAKIEKFLENKASNSRRTEIE
jgi:hypothetical protein